MNKFYFLYLYTCSILYNHVYMLFLHLCYLGQISFKHTPVDTTTGPPPSLRRRVEVQDDSEVPQIKLRWRENVYVTKNKHTIWKVLCARHYVYY